MLDISCFTRLVYYLFLSFSLSLYICMNIFKRSYAISRCTGALLFHEAPSEITVTPPAQRVQFILGEEVGDDAHESHPLFSEMEELVKDGDEMEWKETARYSCLISLEEQQSFFCPTPGRTHALDIF